MRGKYPSRILVVRGLLEAQAKPNLSWDLRASIGIATDAWGSFVCSAGDGECKRAAEATVPINDKMIVLGLQAHNYWGGLISYFNADRGGQAYAYKPELP